MVSIGHIRGRARSEAGGEMAVDLVRRIAALSQKQARKLFESGKVHLDGAPCLDWLAPVPAGSVITVDTDRRRPERLPRLSRRDIVHLDRSFVVVDKPACLVSVPPTRTGEPTLLDLLAGLLAEEPGGPIPLPLHRLDRETSGLMAFGLAGGALEPLRRQFARHEVGREYRALVWGRMCAATLEGSIDNTRRKFGGRQSARYARTEVVPLAVAGPATLVACRPATGRFHQLRVQLAGSGHPIAGEKEHLPDGFVAPVRVPRLALRSVRLTLVNPDTGAGMCWEVPLGEYIEGLMRRMEGRGG